jgi:phage tail sheath gpL-like
MANKLTFDTIDRTNRDPRRAIELDTKKGARGLPPVSARILVLGQKLAAGGANVATLDLISRESEAQSAYGLGSPLDFMVRNVLLNFPSAELWGCSVADDGAGVSATETVTITGPATKDGVLELDIGNDTVRIAFLSGDAQNTIASALNAAINAFATGLPVTSAVATNVVTCTARSKGPIGNGIKLAARVTSGAGVAVALQNANGFLAGGATAPSLTAALAAAAAQRFHAVIPAFDDSTSWQAIRNYLDAQGNGENKKGQIGFGAVNGALATATTLATAISGERCTIAAINESPTWFPMIAAAYGAKAMLEQRVVRPLNGVELLGVKAPAKAKEWTATERKNLINSGVAPLVVTAGDRVRIKRSVSTKVVNTAGNPDYTLLDIQTMRGLDRTRDAVDAMFEAQFGQCNIADADPDGLLPPDVATPKKVEDALRATAKQLEEEGTLQNVSAHADEFIVEKIDDGVQYAMPCDVLQGLHVVYGKHVLSRL